MTDLDEISRLFTQEWINTPGGFESVWLILFMAFSLGQVIAYVYMWTHTGLSYSRNFTVAMAVIPTIVALVMLVMIDSIVVAFGLFAVFAIVRFRNIVKDTRDTSFVLWAILTGLSIGTMKFSLAVVGSVTLAAFFLYMHYVSFGSRIRFDTMLSLQWDGSAERMRSIGELLERHSARTELASQRGSQGQPTDSTYHLLLRDPARGAELVSELQSVAGVQQATIYKRQDESEV
ncbi:MAG: DUF4956 domain-containing protein [Phycisphaerales bacterium]|nr:DUF4956 domain-containing protein [Planctomycetota bacterium]MCH8507257.1 DUF4956 domain-containing protein [Phycisphaerales bacterium]